MTRLSPAAERRVLAGIRSGTAVAWALLVLFVFAGSAGDNPLRGTAKTRRGIVSWAPQGWSFFTRSPREAILTPHRQTTFGWEYAGMENASYRNAFGLSRRARTLNVELHALAAQVPPARWLDCSGPPSSCVDGEPVEVENLAMHPVLCGEHLLAKRPLVPWAWSRSRDRIHMPGSVARIQVRCDS